MGDKFRRSNSSVLTLNAQTLTCILDVDYDEAVDVYWSDCDDATGEKTPVAGGIQTTGTFTQEVDDSDVTMLGYTAPNVSGAWQDQPGGVTGGDIKITSATATITGRQIRTTRTGLATVQCSFVCVGLTIAGN